jgi:transposase
VFFDTTSIYFEGEGGESIGQRGHSKDHRPDLKQMVVGAALDEKGRPLCCKLLPGNSTDVKLLIPVIKGMQARFGAGVFCVVADRGMISKKALLALEAPGSGIDYILGCRMRKDREVRDKVLSRPGGHYQEVEFEREGSSEEPLHLKVKEVKIEGRRYIVCLNPQQAKKDAADRKAIVASLEEKLTQGEKALVGNKGYRKYVKTEGGEAHFVVDHEKMREEARYDGKWVLRTNTDYSAEQVAFQYKQLWMVEQAFRTVKSVLETRPIYHKCDDTIRGHVFCSFLALVLMKELLSRLEARSKIFEWEDIKRDLEALREVEIRMDGDNYYLRTELRGTCFDVLAAAGVAVPPTLHR